MAKKIPITDFQEGNCCPVCGSSKVVLYMQYPLFAEFDMRGKQILKDHRGKRVYRPSNKLLAAEYKNAISDWEWAFYKLCTPLGQAAFTAIEAIKKLQQYRELGTEEELREAMEKQRAKRPIKRSFIIPSDGINVCPNCKKPIYRDNRYCGNCGQAIDWSEERSNHEN